MARYISVAHEGLDSSCVDRDGLKVRISYVGVPRHADRQQMEALVTAVIRIGRQLTGHPGPEGEAMFRHACAMGLEGIVPKRVTSRYKSGSNLSWLKVRIPAYERRAGGVAREDRADTMRALGAVLGCGPGGGGVHISIPAMFATAEFLIRSPRRRGPDPFT